MTIKIYIPRDTTSLSLGADEIAEHVNLVINEQQLSNIKVVRNGSRGLFWLETLVEVETEDGRFAYGPVMPDDVESLLQAGLLSTEQPTAHPLALGLTAQIPYLKKQTRLTFSRAGVIDPTDVQDYQAHGGFKGLDKALSMTSAAIINDVTESGLRGRGGAAFPAGIKWKTVADASLNDVVYLHAPKQKYIVCNADEGDSGTFADRLVMEADPLMLIEGMTIAALAVGATQGYIYLRSEYPQAKRILQEAIQAAYEQQLLGDIKDSGKHFDLSVRMGAGAYICGEETALLESIEGKRGVVRSKPPLPALQGLFGQPTVMNNVLTFAAVPYILANGGSAYANFGVGRSLGTMPFQLAGNIQQGGLIELAFGPTLQTLVDDFGLGTVSGKPIKAIQVGGPLGAYLSKEQWQTELSYEAFQAIGGTLGHGGIVVFDDDVNMTEQARFAMAFCAEESCGKCTPCRIGAVRGVEVIDKLVQQSDKQAQQALLDDLCDTMEYGSLCAMGGMTPNPVRSAMRIAFQEIK